MGGKNPQSNATYSFEIKHYGLVSQEGLRPAVLNPRPNMLNVTVLCVEHNKKNNLQFYHWFQFLHSFKNELNKYKLMLLLCKII